MKTGAGEIVLEHVLREETIEVGITASGWISKANRINCPVASLFGDAQRYQGTNLTWPVVNSHGFEPSVNPIKATFRKISLHEMLIDFRVQFGATER